MLALGIKEKAYNLKQLEADKATHLTRNKGETSKQTKKSIEPAQQQTREESLLGQGEGQPTHSSRKGSLPPTLSPLFLLASGYQTVNARNQESTYIFGLLSRGREWA